jgi:glutamate--cysteine ligase
VSNPKLFASTKTQEAPLQEQDLADWFVRGLRPARKVGIEIEYGLVRGDSGRSVSYDEPSGAKDFLERLLKRMDGSPIYEGHHLVGLSLADGSAFSLEMGGAIEYSSPPTRSVSESVDLASRYFREAARVADEIDIAILTGGTLPFDRPAAINWVPKPRTALMRRHFDSLGPDGSRGDHVMGLTLSTQVTLDAGSEGDYVDKFLTMLRVSPFLAAATLNTPSLPPGDKILSIRIIYWRQIDPARCQDLNTRLADISSIDDLVRVLTEVPMIYRPVGGEFTVAPALPFAELLRRGYGDGTSPGMTDWQSHLAQLWPWVRPRQTLESRLPDGQAWGEIDLIPALWTGLIEDEVSRRAAAELVSEFSAPELDQISISVADRADGPVDKQVRDITQELVALARAGMLRRVAAGLEDGRLLLSLDKLLDMLSRGQTFADELLARWQGEWREEPERYVAAMAIPVDD